MTVDNYVPQPCLFEKIVLFMATIILFCAYRVNSAVRQIGVCRADDRKIPSPGGKGDREAVDEERRPL